MGPAGPASCRFRTTDLEQQILQTCAIYRQEKEKNSSSFASEDGGMLLSDIQRQRQLLSF